MTTSKQSDVVLRFLSTEVERQELGEQDGDASVYFELPYGDYSWADIKKEIEENSEVGQRYTQKLIDAAIADGTDLEAFLGIEP